MSITEGRDRLMRVLCLEQSDTLAVLERVQRDLQCINCTRLRPRYRTVSCPYCGGFRKP